MIYAFLPYEGEYLISVEDYYAYMNPAMLMAIETMNMKSTLHMVTPHKNLIHWGSLSFELDDQHVEFCRCRNRPGRRF